MTSPGHEPDPFAWRALVVVGLVALATAAAVVLWSAREVFLLAFAGLLVAVFLHAPASFASRRTRLPYGGALAAWALLLVVLATGGLWLLGPSVGEQVVQLAERLPGAVEALLEAVGSVPVGAWLLDRLAGEAEAVAPGAGVISTVTGTAAALANVVTKAVFVGFLGLFLATAPRRYREGLVRLLPRGRRAAAREATRSAYLALRGWVLGQLVSITLVGLVTWLGLSLIGVPLALVLGIIAGLAELVPVFGPLVGFVPAALLALSLGATHLLWVTALFLTVQLLQGNVVAPLIQQRAVDLPPALTITAVFVSGAVFGPVGLLIATPLLAVLLVLVKLLYLRDALGERVDVPGAASGAGGRVDVPGAASRAGGRGRRRPR